MPHGMEVGIGSGHIVLAGVPVPAKKGSDSSPKLLARLLWPNGWIDQDATWYEGRPRLRPHCVRWGPSSGQVGHRATEAPPLTFLPMSTVAQGSPISATSLKPPQSRTMMK